MKNTNEQPNFTQLPTQNLTSGKEITNQKGNPLVIMGVVLAIIIVGAGTYYLGVNKDKSSTNVNNQQIQASPTTQSTPTGLQTSSTDETANWKTYTNTQQSFTIKYPNGVEIEEENGGGVLLILLGPTQKRGAGFYDGIFLRFKSNSLKDKNINQVADEELQKEKDTFDTNGHVIENTKQVTLAGISGYTYTIANVGIHTFTYLPNKSGGYVIILNSTVDPTGKDFQKSADQILSTFKFISQ